MLKHGLLGVMLALVGPLSLAGQKSGASRIDWISGCWASDDGKERIEEVWLKPAGDSMMGMSRTVVGSKTVFTEYIQIREINGQTSYVVALGLSAKPVAFKLIKLSENEVIFENKEHDFPQRIIYRRDSEESLFARIEGTEKGVNKALDFPYKRQRCE